VEIFEFTKAANVSEAIAAAVHSGSAQQGARVRFVAGGTTLLDLMKLEVERPNHVVDINRLPLAEVERLGDGRLKIGALVRNSDLANHPAVRSDYAVLSQALLAGASAQLRNMATTGGNLLQRTRCAYFRNAAMACNKRLPGSGCAAIDGENRSLAILGTSADCIATNPSDMNVALTALEAVIRIEGIGGERDVAIGEFFILPGSTPECETVLAPGDLITSVTLPAPAAGNNQVYLKLRDRASYEFALASTAVIAKVEAGKIAFVRIALGGVGTVPWRSFEGERALYGENASEVSFRRAADAALAGARPQSQNAFKVELAKRCIVHALTLVTATARETA
jgi:xanthine dehydrogenase YagS FAD-binding subunit